MRRRCPSVCLCVRSSVRLSLETHTQKRAFSKTKQFRAIVSIDDQYGHSKESILGLRGWPWVVISRSLMSFLAFSKKQTTPFRATFTSDGSQAVLKPMHFFDPWALVFIARHASCILTRDIDIAILSVRPSVLHVPLLDENGLTVFPPYGSTVILALSEWYIFTKFRRGHPLQGR